MTLRSLVVLMTGERTSDGEIERNYNASLIQVIANPSDFNSQRLTVVGYLGRNGIDMAVGTAEFWWARQDLNLGPTDYESAALTAELQARTLLHHLTVKELNVEARLTMADGSK
jgi:hypothetical protein